MNISKYSVVRYVWQQRNEKVECGWRKKTKGNEYCLSVKKALYRYIA